MSHIVAELVIAGRVKRRVTVSASGDPNEACRAMVDAGWRRTEGITGAFNTSWKRPGERGECMLRRVEAAENHIALVTCARLANLS